MIRENTFKADQDLITIRSVHGWSALNLRDLWKYRELLYFMVWRDVKVRYKQAVLGVAWAILLPVVIRISPSPQTTAPRGRLRLACPCVLVALQQVNGDRFRTSL